MVAAAAAAIRTMRPHRARMREGRGGERATLVMRADMKYACVVSKRHGAGTKSVSRETGGRRIRTMRARPGEETRAGGCWLTAG
jgi:hypothetical protein